MVWAELVNDVFELSVLAKKKRKGTQLALVRITGEIEEEEKALVNSFTDAVMATAYAGKFHAVHYMFCLFMTLLTQV